MKKHIWRQLGSTFEVKCLNCGMLGIKWFDGIRVPRKDSQVNLHSFAAHQALTSEEADCNLMLASRVMEE